jgi:hypothetical protein
MRVTKAMLEETNEFLRSNMERITTEKMLLEREVKLLNGVIATYSRMPSLLIATERITEALAQTISRISKR